MIVLMLEQTERLVKNFEDEKKEKVIKNKNNIYYKDINE